jgi:hypothetical protein
VILFGLLYT